MRERRNFALLLLLSCTALSIPTSGQQGATPSHETQQETGGSGGDGLTRNQSGETTNARPWQAIATRAAFELTLLWNVTQFSWHVSTICASLSVSFSSRRRAIRSKVSRRSRRIVRVRSKTASTVARTSSSMAAAVSSE